MKDINGKTYKAIITHSDYKGGSKLSYMMDLNKKWLRILGIETLAKYNEAIIGGRASEIKMLSEMLHEKRLGYIADSISASHMTKRVVLIAGPSSSGKTTFARRLVTHLRMFGIMTEMISMDNYFYDRDKTPVDEFGKHNLEAVEAIDLDLLNSNILSLLEGREVDQPVFGFISGKREPAGVKTKIGSETVIIIEGIHGLDPKLTHSVPDEMKFKIYISAIGAMLLENGQRITSSDTRFIRRLTRDYKYRGIEAATTISRWQSVRRGEERYIFPFQETGDVLFDSSLPYELSLLKSYTRAVLLKVTSDLPEYSEASRLINLLNRFETVDKDFIPAYSLIREFIGGSYYEAEI